MTYRANYPATVAECLDDRKTFKPAALRAVRDLARAKPWRGSPSQRFAKLRACLFALAQAYSPPPQRLIISKTTPDCYVPHQRTIFLRPSLSVVTFLHEFAHARGFDEHQACRWSINLFRRCFPRSYSRCEHVRHMLIKQGREVSP